METICHTTGAAVTPSQTRSNQTRGHSNRKPSASRWPPSLVRLADRKKSGVSLFSRSYGLNQGAAELSRQSKRPSLVSPLSVVPASLGHRRRTNIWRRRCAPSAPQARAAAARPYAAGARPPGASPRFAGSQQCKARLSAPGCLPFAQPPGFESVKRKGKSGAIRLEIFLSCFRITARFSALRPPEGWQHRNELRRRQRSELRASHALLPTFPTPNTEAERVHGYCAEPLRSIRSPTCVY